MLLDVTYSFSSNHQKNNNKDQREIGGFSRGLVSFQRLVYDNDRNCQDNSPFQEFFYVHIGRHQDGKQQPMRSGARLKLSAVKP
jgi:hypothetical protein